jgi:hypothetical protein
MGMKVISCNSLEEKCENLKERDNLKDMEVESRVILKCILK